MTASLLVLANGGQVPDGVTGVRRHVRDYGQSAMIARVEVELPHCNVAYERFTADGPVALLPTGERGFALVWTALPERAEELCRLQQQEFLDQLGLHFGERVGRFIVVAGRTAFPLKLSRTSPVTALHMVVIGNAAQTLHPVAGQGFNLGLRDAWRLAQLVRSTPHERIGDAAMLALYRRRRLPDRMGGICFTDFMATAFALNLPGLASVRGIGMGVLDLLAPAKHFLSRRMSFGAQE
jgi:2-octaprenyl-6-methoxyphenol hydroxylase